MGPIEKTLFEIESNRIQQSNSEENKISPRVQLFLDECKRIITILKDDDLFEKEREKYL
jgi:hypothetical protein